MSSDKGSLGSEARNTHDWGSNPLAGALVGEGEKPGDVIRSGPRSLQ